MKDIRIRDEIVGLKPEIVFKYFEFVSSIPRPSLGEEDISNRICKWAKDKGFSVQQDEAWNLVIKKPGAKGKEKSEPLILQAHMDMVCEKTEDSEHDFSKDPIKMKIEGDWIVSADGTTLGGDNGIGVALAMAALDDDTINNPPLEVIFTTDEERGFKGAKTLSPQRFKSNRMINLDYTRDDTILAGSCGGTAIDYGMETKTMSLDTKDFEIFEIEISGLIGGHSGVDIHRGRGNAIMIMAELLKEVLKSLSKVYLLSWQGGNFRLAIPRGSKMRILVPCEEAEKTDSVIKDVFRTYRAEIPKEDLAIDCRKISRKETAIKAISSGEILKIVNLLSLFPNEVVGMSGAVEGTVESSDNIGELSLNEEGFLLTAEARSNTVYGLKLIKDKVLILADMFGGKVKFYDEYVPWIYRNDSPLREISEKTYESLFGGKPDVTVVHAGLEVGFFQEKDPTMDAVALGPVGEFLHSPAERLSISSTEKMWYWLREIIESC